MQEKYQELFDLFERKKTLEKGMDSFETVTKIEKAVFDLLQEIFHPYKITQTPSTSPKAPDGNIKMSQNLIFYEILSGKLDRFQAYRINEIIDYARDEVVTIMYPGQVYSIFIVCRNYSEEAIEVLQQRLYKSVRRPRGLSVVTPEALVKLHELCTRNVKIKDHALTTILETVGPLTVDQIEKTFSTLAEKKEMPFLETPIGPLRVTLEYGDIKTQFEGNFDEVWRGINRFLTEIRPSHVESALAKIVHKEELDQLVKDLQGVLRIAKEGPYFITSIDNLRNQEKLGLALLGAYVGYKLGILDENALSIDELCSMTGIKRTVASVELSNMSRARLVETIEDGKRRLTTIGIDYIQTSVLSKMKVSEK